MKAKLIRHEFPDTPDWIIINPSIPLGTEYEVLGYDSNMVIFDRIYNRRRIVDCFLVTRDDGNPGYIPTICLEVINENPAPNQRN